MSESIILSEAELESVTQYKRACDQIPELIRRGFYRARVSKTTGRVILERAHYDAVVRGAGIPANDDSQRRPTLRAVK